MASDPIPEVVPEKKKHRWLWVVLAIIIILPLLFLGWTGIYSIPVLTDLFGSRKPIDLGVVVSNEALASAIADNPMDLEGDPAEYSGVAKKIYTGQVPINDQHSSEEMTSFLQHYTQNAPYIRDLQVKFIDGGMEISAFVKEYVKAPVYIKVGVEKTGVKSIKLNLQKAKIGRLSVPETYYDDIEKFAEDVINDKLTEIEGFTIDKLEYTDGQAYLKGTLPEKVELVSGEEDKFWE